MIADASTPLRIGLISYSAPPRIGGGARQLVQISQSLTKRGAIVSIVSPDHSVGEDLNDSWLDRFRKLFALRKKIRQLNPNVDVWLSLDFQVGVLAAVLAGIRTPLVACFGADPLLECKYLSGTKDLTESDLKWRDSNAYSIGAMLLRPFYAKPNAVIVWSESAARDVPRFTSSPVQLIRPWVESIPRSNIGSSSSPPGARLLVVSRLVQIKRLHFAIEVASRLRKQFPDLTLTIAGDGPLFRDLTAQTKKFPWLRLLGRVPPEKMNELYTNADLLLHTPVFETFGLAIVEALCNGLPVICSNLEPMHRLVKDQVTGALCSPFDSCSWEKSIADLLSDPDRLARMKCAAQAENSFFLSAEPSAGTIYRVLEQSHKQQAASALGSLCSSS